MSSPEGIQDFNKTLLNIRKYAVGKEKEELLTLGRSFADIKYIVKEDGEKIDNNENKTNLGINAIKNNNMKEGYKIGFNKIPNKKDVNINNNKDNKEEMNKNDKDNNKENLNDITEKKPRRSSTSKDVNKYNNTKLVKNNLVEGTSSAFDSKKIPKKESNILLRNNNLMRQANNTLNMNSVNSKREINKANSDKVYPIIDPLIKKNNNSNKSLSKDKKTNNINNNSSTEKKDSLEIIYNIDLDDPNIKEDNLEIKEEMKIYDTFCIGVFISGLSPPIKTTSIIENSENFMAPCGHLQCSIYPSLQPDLLHTYLNKNAKNFKYLSHLVANMCFPLGVKPCFGCRFDENNKIDNLPNPQQTFFNIIKNEKNEIYYIATLQYFIKMSNADYLMKYKFNPITYFLDKGGGTSNNKDKNFKNNMKMISNSLNNNNVFIPESISLISKYPFFISMDKCLRCMISLQSEDMNNLINHLVNEVPSPKKNYQIKFFIPKIRAPIILNHEYNKFLSSKNDNNNLLSASQINVKFLLEKISVENIIMIFQLILLEQKILFLENNYQILSEISFIFLELIYPLIWINPFLPVLSIKTVQFLQSPVPYIMGLDEYLLKYASESSSIYLGTEMIIFNIMSNQFISSKTRKRIHKKDIFHEFKLPTIPDKIGDYIYKELKYMKKLIEKIEKHKEKKEKLNEIVSDEEIDRKIRTIFLKAMIMLIGDYNNFLFYTEDEIPLFNKEAFVQSHKDKNSQLFLGEMVKTQIFNQFLLNEKQLYIKTKNKLKDITQNNMNWNDQNLQKKDEKDNQINYELVDTSYFKKIISVHHDLLNSEKIRNRASSSKRFNTIKSGKKLVSQRKSKFTLYNKKNEEIQDKKDIQKGNNINFVDSQIPRNKDSNMLYKIDNNRKMGNGNYSIDYIRGKNNKFNSNINLSGSVQNNNEENNLENINKNDKFKSAQRNKSVKKIINFTNNIINFNDSETILPKNVFNEEIKQILLYPYFLPNLSKRFSEVTLKTIEDAIEIYTQKRKFKFQCQDKDHIFIISKRHEYNFNDIAQKRLYIIKKNNSDNFNINDNSMIRNEKYIDDKFTKNESIDNIDLKEIKNYLDKTNLKNSSNSETHCSFISMSKNPEETKLIKDCFINCYTNKSRITKEQLNSLEKIFMDKDNKMFFANLILPDTKIKKTKNHKQLTSSSFEDIGKILAKSLEYLTSSEYNICRLLTISAFVYYKVENKKLIYLYDYFIHGIYPCRLWLSEAFWENFFENEIEEEKQNENDLINLYKYNFSGSINYMIDIDKNLLEKNKDHIIYDTVMFTAEIMIKLKLSQNFILNSFKNNILKNFVEDTDKINYLINQILELFDKL